MPSVLAKVLERSDREKKAEPLWAGPSGAGPQGGVTQGLIGRYLVCPERFRIKVIEGLGTPSKFSKQLEYGQMWHTCEEHFASSGEGAWQVPLTEYTRGLLVKYPFQQQEVVKWFEVCKRQFPVYVDYWRKHPDVAAREPLLEEQTFDVPYSLPSGRTVRLRGKWDSVDLVKCAVCQGTGKIRFEAGAGRATGLRGLKTCPRCNGAKGGIWLQENKTKGDIDEEQLRKQLRLDLQTMLYLTALKEVQDNPLSGPEFNKHLINCSILGVRYNVVKRPLSGGKGSIVQHAATKGAKCPKCKGERMVAGVKCPKCNGAGRTGAKPAETDADYYGRLAQYIKDEPETYFMRWNVEVSAADVGRFQARCLDPILENLCDDYEHWAWCRESEVDPFDMQRNRSRFHGHCKRHFVFPFGVYSSLIDGGATDTDEFVMTGNSAGLSQVKDLFPELNGQ